MVTENLPKRRSDALPENTEYRDTGCDAYPSCLSCPFAVCRYDVTGGVRGLRNRQRNAEIERLRLRDGLSADEVADRFGLSRRTVFRVTEMRAKR